MDSRLTILGYLVIVITAALLVESRTIKVNKNDRDDYNSDYETVTVIWNEWAHNGDESSSLTTDDWSISSSSPEDDSDKETTTNDSSTSMASSEDLSNTKTTTDENQSSISSTGKDSTDETTTEKSSRSTTSAEDDSTDQTTYNDSEDTTTDSSSTLMASSGESSTEYDSNDEATTDYSSTSMAYSGETTTEKSSSSTTSAKDDSTDQSTYNDSEDTTTDSSSTLMASSEESSTEYDSNDEATTDYSSTSMAYSGETSTDKKTTHEDPSSSSSTGEVSTDETTTISGDYSTDETTADDSSDDTTTDSSTTSMASSGESSTDETSTDENSTDNEFSNGNDEKNCLYKVARQNLNKKLNDFKPYKLDDNCGAKLGKKKVAKIIGGNNVDPNEYPWMVALGSYSSNHFSQFCGGTLIDKDWVLTAAHCVAEYESQCIDAKGFAVKVGEHHLQDVSEHEKIIRVKKIIIHKDYNGDGIPRNDIALVQLSESAEINEDEIGAACITKKEHNNFMNSLCYVTGWGATENEDSPNTAKEVNVKLVDFKKCNKEYDGVLHDGMLCAGKKGSGKDSCQGDSGGPLVCKDKNRKWYLVGVVSWGYGCAEEHSGVYADVFGYKNWIENVITQEQ